MRKISIEGLRDASGEKFLKFGVWAGHEVYAVTDIAKKTAELRRLDGQMFEAYGSMPAHKSHTLKHSRKNWPLGIIEAADSAAIALVDHALMSLVNAENPRPLGMMLYFFVNTKGSPFGSLALSSTVLTMRWIFLPFSMPASQMALMSFASCIPASAMAGRVLSANTFFLIMFPAGAAVDANLTAFWFLAICLIASLHFAEWLDQDRTSHKLPGDS